MAESETPESADVSAAQRVLTKLALCYPSAECELDFTSPFELLVATIISAQSTDKRVNTVTPALFAEFGNATQLAGASRERVEEIIRPTGFFRAKTDSLLKAAAKLVADFDGEVPGTLEELVTLPGVGRKTANVVLGNAFGVPGLTPDTHFMRVSRRLGWTSSQKPDQVEADVAELLPASQWVEASHLLIWHGRRRCHARNPACGACPVWEDCPSFGEGETDPIAAEKLVREPRG